MEIVVFKLPGFPDRFKATLIPGLHRIETSDQWRFVSVISTEEARTLAVNSRHVFTPEGLAYAREWASLTGESVFDVEIPEAFRVL